MRGGMRTIPRARSRVALAVLVVSCPCALSLAIPAALAVAQGALSRIGVLPLRDAIDTLARADAVVFDKTGTLGDGRPRVDAVENLRRHGARTRPRAPPRWNATAGIRWRAFAAIATPLQASRCAQSAEPRHRRRHRRENLPARAPRFRRRRFRRRRRRRPVARRWRHRVRASRCARANAPTRRRRSPGLRAQGLAMVLCSGDGPDAVQRLARSVRIADARARQSPADKLSRSLARTGRRAATSVAMVGDGLNDAPVLAGADVSLRHVRRRGAGATRGGFRGRLALAAAHPAGGRAGPAHARGGAPEPGVGAGLQPDRALPLPRAGTCRRGSPRWAWPRPRCW